MSQCFSGSTVNTIANVSGLQELWATTLGDPNVCVALLDGPVDTTHPSLQGATLTQLNLLQGCEATQAEVLRHGTQVASIVFGDHSGPIRGIAPHCRGLLLSIFTESENGHLLPCSQLDLARAITLAVEQGANVINISGGELTESSAPDPLLSDAINGAADAGTIIIAAAGNQGCECLNIPAAVQPVLAVGAMNHNGEPLALSNWGPEYMKNGVLAIGENVPCAIPGNGTAVATGTSFAAPVVTGVVALLLSLVERGRDHQRASRVIREAIISSSTGCNRIHAPDCSRLLAGRLSIPGVIETLKTQGAIRMSDNLNASTKKISTMACDSASDYAANAEPATETRKVSDLATPVNHMRPTSEHACNDLARAPSQNPHSEQLAPLKPSSPDLHEVKQRGSVSSEAVPSACGCEAQKHIPPQLVYALGLLGVDFGSEAHRDSVMQYTSDGSNIFDLMKGPFPELAESRNMDA